MPSDAYSLTISSPDELTLALSDQGVAIPSTHAPAHASGGSDPITISYTQVTGLGTMATQAASAVSITGGSITGITDLAVADGGTGASTPAAARTNLELGTLSTQAASLVAVTGGAINGTSIGQSTTAAGSFTTLTASTSAALNTLSLTTDLAVAHGGTGVSTLTGVAIGNGGVSSFSAATSSTAGQVLRCTGSNTFAFGALDLADSDAVTGALPVARGGTGGTTESASRTALGVPSIDDTIRWYPSITALTGGASNALDSIDVSSTTTWPNNSTAAIVVSGNLHVYRLTVTAASESSPTVIHPDTYGGRAWVLVSVLPSNIAITGGSITGITDLAVADGGTGVSTLTGIVRGNGATAMSAVTSTTVGQVLRCTGADTFAFGALDLSDPDAVTGTLPVSAGGTGGGSAGAARTSLGFVAGSGTLTAGSGIDVSLTGATSSSHIVAVHRSSGVGALGALTVVPGTNKITVSSSDPTDDNDFTYFGTL